MRDAGNRSARQEDEHHGHHQEGEDHLHGVLQESHHIAHLQRRLRHLVRPHPDDEYGKTVHQQHHQGHHHHHDAVDKEAVAGEVLVGFIKALKFKRPGC